MAAYSFREIAFFFAKEAEMSQNYQDVVEEMKKVAIGYRQLTSDERVLLANGYNNVIWSQRSLRRVLSSMERSEENTQRIKQAETEMYRVCNDAISVVNRLITPHIDAESFVFYHKMLGDFYRYLAELKSGDEKQRFSFNSFEPYMVAYVYAESRLRCTHPTRLAVALNFSVYFYEILKFPHSAIDMAQKAYDEAISGGIIDVQSHQNTSLIVQLLWDNLNIWRSIQMEGTGDNFSNNDGGDDAVQTDYFHILV